MDEELVGEGQGSESVSKEYQLPFAGLAWLGIDAGGSLQIESAEPCSLFHLSGCVSRHYNGHPSAVCQQGGTLAKQGLERQSGCVAGHAALKVRVTQGVLEIGRVGDD